MRHFVGFAVFALLMSITSLNTALACDQNLPMEGTRDDVLIIVNDNSIDSCEVGRYYAERRQLGRSNILHIRAPATHNLSWADFKNLRDQIIRHLQQRILAEQPTLAPATCLGTESPYYCEAVLSQVRDQTRIRYLVMTKGVPPRTFVDGSILFEGHAATSADNYLKYWLLNDFSTDTAFGTVALARATAFGDGRGQRIVNPALDREFIVGRIDGITRQSAMALVDRALAGEADGIYGKIYTYPSQARSAGNGMRWKDYSKGSQSVYVGGTDPWRYQLGMYDEQARECADYDAADSYLRFAPNLPTGKAPPHCKVKLSVSPRVNQFGDNLPGPGTPGSREPLVDDALIFMGHQDEQASGEGLFSNLQNWRRDTACTNTLCETLPISEQAQCRAASVDAYKELDTRCMGVSDGFMGFHFISYSLDSPLNVQPTGWQAGGSADELFPAHVSSTDGADDTSSLWFLNQEEASNPVCFQGTDFASPPSRPCKVTVAIKLSKAVDLGATHTSLPGQPDQYRLRFKYKHTNLDRQVRINATLRLREATSSQVVTYADTFATPAMPVGITSGWTQAEVVVAVDPNDTEHTPGWNGQYRTFDVYLTSNTGYSGAIGFDDFSLARVTAGSEVPIALSNPTFTDGHKSVSHGDFAANYLSRMNGVAMWGSMSHHESGGLSFANHMLETLLYFQRGLPLGDSVWFAEGRNSGLLFGDPIYSPIAVKLNDPGASKFISQGTPVTLSGAAVNGTDLVHVTTQYAINYCAGTDFYLCDRAGSWQPTGLNGAGGRRDMAFGNWSPVALAPGEYTLRLTVTSTHALTGKTQTFNDFQQIVLYNASSDFDQDGLTDSAELASGSLTTPDNPDFDSDGLLDGEEVNAYHTDPTLSDTDGDFIDDANEVAYGMNPLIDDAIGDIDGDGATNGFELLLGLDPRDPASKPAMRTLYVDTANTGSVENGSQQHPFKTLASALGTVESGDTLHIAAGDYGVPNSGIPFDIYGLRIIGAGLDATRLTSSSSLFINWWFGEISNLNLTIASGNGINLNNSLSVSLSNVRITSPQEPLSIDNSRHILATGFELVSQNTGLRFSGVQRVTVKNCLVTGNGAASNTGMSFTAWSGADDAYIDHCTVANFDQGIAFENRTPTSVVAERFVIHNSIVDAQQDFSPSNSVQPALSYTLTRNGSKSGLDGNLGGSPQFVDPANKNYRLLPTSPAVGTGDPATPIGLEPVGNSRVNLGYYGGTAEATPVLDQDSDGLPDGYESSVGLNPGVSNAGADSDSDGYSDVVEFNLGFAPNNGALHPQAPGGGGSITTPIPLPLIGLVGFGVGLSWLGMLIVRKRRY